ncbi:MULTISPECIES: ornithine carbamoyltransferase [Halococcus]|uniref:Ornithine carbamoyltransferase n=1 Tax=Halococcus salifodinae DSM 8989 TaxID=1227456 RepID=M0NBY5_9EURY|nr:MULTISPECIES: ornithine carbamoyltransferase [Halococcus]EMA55073.1 ornithine carbamoyltransferase [Halococcus salifodinae DSM 8989]
MTRHFTDIDDLSADELETVLDTAAELKTQVEHDEPHPLLERRTLGMVFEKPSARTRISFETGMTQLGGHAIFLGPDDIGLGEREPLKDTARTLSGYVDCAMVRLFDHADLEELAAYADVPIVNGLTDDAHPCQTLADLLTLRETVGFDARVAWVGDGNNVAQSFVLGCALAGIDLTVATPPEHGIDPGVLDRAATIGTAPDVTTDPEAAVAGADAVYTDVWVSMGEEAERETKLATFEESGFQMNANLLPEDATVLHCLPAHRGEEITENVLESDRAAVWQQAENRLHAQKGLLAFLLDAL